MTRPAPEGTLAAQKPVRRGCDRPDQQNVSVSQANGAPASSTHKDPKAPQRRGTVPSENGDKSRGHMSLEELRMANTHVKKCSSEEKTSSWLTIREMQTKTTTYHND